MTIPLETVSATDAAALLGLSRERLRQLAMARELPERVGDSSRFRPRYVRSEIEAFGRVTGRIETVAPAEPMRIRVNQLELPAADRQAFGRRLPVHLPAELRAAPVSHSLEECERVFAHLAGEHRLTENANTFTRASVVQALAGERAERARGRARLTRPPVPVKTRLLGELAAVYRGQGFSRSSGSRRPLARRASSNRRRSRVAQSTRTSFN